MATVDEVARGHQVEQSRLAIATASAAAAQWTELEPGNLLASWLGRVGRIIVALVTAGQYNAAARSTAYLRQMAELQGGTPTAPIINPAVFAGIASDGRLLDSLLLQPLLQVLKLLNDGMSSREAMRRGQAALQMIARTQVADAGRAADGAGVAADKRYVMYVRQVHLPACARCIILAGRAYMWSTGFLRHPMCDCTMTPVFYNASTGKFDQPLPASPKELFERMNAAQQDKAFTKSGAEAIRDGADLGRVVNARRGMKTAGGRIVTTTGTGRRKKRGPARLMPEQILKDAHGDRDAAIRLLKEHGFIL